MVKAFLAPKVKNARNWLLKFLALETSDFLDQIHFFDFAVCWLLQLFCASFYSSRSTWILLLSYSLASIFIDTAGPIAEPVFSIELSEAANLLNP